MIGGASKPYRAVALEDIASGKRFFGKYGGRKKGDLFFSNTFSISENITL
jgi:hypothetical protein